MANAPSKARFFLNVDLDVESTEDLLPLIKALEPSAYSLERPPGRASFELNEPSGDPELRIMEFVHLVSGLPPDARRLWDRASQRVFDIGLQSAREPPFHERHRLSRQTLQSIAAIGAELAITIYALDPNDDAAR